MDIIKDWNLESEFNFNRQDNVITFNNGSEVILMDLFHNPSDEEYVKLGSLELTTAVIDEGGEISEKAYTILKTRLRYKLNEYNLAPKLLIVSNPTKNWLYKKFYKPSLTDDLPEYRKFIKALPKDNPFNSQQYLDSLTPETLSQPIYERLVLGNWEYDNSDYSLFNYETIARCFNTLQNFTSFKKYITCDPAGMGADSTVITFWEGWHCAKIIELPKSDTPTTVNAIRALQQEHNVPTNHIIIDKVGIGAGVFDLIKGSQGFVANARPFKDEAYSSLKDQMYYKFAQAIDDGIVSIGPIEHLETISQELEAHKIFNIESDKKAQVTPKKIVKTIIGRSPDFADALAMRCWWQYKTIGKISIIRK